VAVAPREGNKAEYVRSVTSCRSCLAWGMTYCQGVCLACYNFAARNRTTGECGACARCELLKKGFCRLCWAQAELERPTGPHWPLLPYVQGVRDQQLFLADLGRRREQPRVASHRYCTQIRPERPPRVQWPQLQLFNAPRVYRYGRFDLRTDLIPSNPWLEWALHLAHTTAEARGFGEPTRGDLNRTLVMLLANHREGELIRCSDFYGVLRERRVSIERTVEILARMGVLDDDRPVVSTFERWLAGKLDGLVPGIRSETERWARALHDGSARKPARKPETLANYLRVARPALLEWSRRYHHLREVTRADILTHVDALHGRQRDMTTTALRSLFAWAKKNRVVFRNPATRIPPSGLEPAVWQPLSTDEISGTIRDAVTPQARLFVVLAGVHAARSQAIRALALEDVDLPNRRLTIAGRTRPLDDLTYRALHEWLDHRRRRWPNTPNGHLLINIRTATGAGPVSKEWAARVLRGLPGTLERLRVDRQLEEALAHRADPLHLTAVFDIHESTAIRYATSARQLLERPYEAHLVGSPQTQVLSDDEELTAT
jgi:integrase